MKAALGRLKGHRRRPCKNDNEGKRKCKVPEVGMSMTWSRDGNVAARRQGDGRRGPRRQRVTTRVSRAVTMTQGAIFSTITRDVNIEMF